MSNGKKGISGAVYNLRSQAQPEGQENDSDSSTETLTSDEAISEQNLPDEQLKPRGDPSNMAELEGLKGELDAVKQALAEAQEENSTFHTQIKELQAKINDRPSGTAGTPPPAANTAPQATTADIATAVRAAIQETNDRPVYVQPAYYNPSQRYPKTFAGKPTENGKSHIYGFFDFIDNLTACSPRESPVNTFDFQYGKFRETLEGTARSWLVNHTFVDIPTLKKAFLARFHKPRTAFDDAKVLATPMKVGEDLLAFTDRLLKATNRFEMPDSKKKEALLSLLTPSFKNYALTKEAQSFQDVVHHCTIFDSYNRGVTPISNQNHNSAFPVSAADCEIDDEQITAILARLQQLETRGRTPRQNSPYPGKYTPSAPGPNSKDRTVTFDSRKSDPRSGSGERSSSRGRNGPENYHNSRPPSRERSGDRYTPREGSDNRSYDRSSDRNRGRSDNRSYDRSSDRNRGRSDNRSYDRSYDRNRGRSPNRSFDRSYDRNRGRSSSTGREGPRCYNCDRIGHMFRKCPYPRNEGTFKRRAEIRAMQEYIEDIQTSPKDFSPHST